MAHASGFKKEDNESLEKHSYICDSAADRWQKASTALARHIAGLGLEGWDGPPAQLRAGRSTHHMPAFLMALCSLMAVAETKTQARKGSLARRKVQGEHPEAEEIEKLCSVTY